VTFALILIHVGVAAAWLGSMGYSLFVVQPRVARVLTDPVRAEDLYRELAAGNRWRVVGLITTLALSGLLLTVTVHDGHTVAWWILVAAQAGLLVGASGLFWWVSWRGWPRRIFALPVEIPAEQARFRRVALALAGLVGTAFVLGLASSHLVH
jgi:hypothetical protein